MGCFSSKVAARSSSFKEELNRSLHRRINGFPLLEDMLTSKNNNDQFLALVCTANTVAKKLRTAPQPLDPSPESSVPITEPKTIHETINAWELMADLEEQEKEEEEGRATGHDLSVRSRSFHMLTEYDMGTKTESLRRSRSFHTVAEYDAMVALNVMDTEAQKLAQDGNLMPEKGFRRKTMARQLGTLSIPTTSTSSVVFPFMGNLGELGDRGDAPNGEYTTPKFGSFSGPFSGGGAGGRGAVFDPELLAELEEDMEELTADEELVLGQMVAALGGGGGGGEEEDEGETGNC